MEHGKTPKIRFHGFNDNWEVRKLGDLAEIGDIDHRMPETVDNGIPYLMTGDFININELNFSGVKHISLEDYKKLSSKIKPEKHDILFARYATIGAVRYVDFTGDFLISYSCAIIKNSKKIYSKYLYHFLTSDMAQGQIQLEVNTGSQGNIGIETMKNNINVSFPTHAEQQRIGEYFSRLDDLIGLYKRKLEKSLNFKKAMLAKMFPQNGKPTPQIRFAGFSDNWEVRKLGEVATRHDNLRVPIAEKDRIEGCTPYYGANGIQDYVKGYTHNGEFILVAEDGANDLTNYPVQYVVGKIWVNNHAHVLQAIERVSYCKCLKYAIHRTNIEPFLVGGSRAKLNAAIMMDISIPLPTHAEQQRIGEYFSRLDDLIGLYKRKLEKSLNLKKAMLEKMFP